MIPAAMQANGGNAANGIDDSASTFYEVTSNVGDYWQATFAHTFVGEAKRVARVRILNRAGSDAEA